MFFGPDFCFSLARLFYIQPRLLVRMRELPCFNRPACTNPTLLPARIFAGPTL